jgi:predicted ribosomally synthesized peptide with nif11-like leader
LGFDSGSSVDKRLEQSLRGRPEEPDTWRNVFLEEKRRDVESTFGCPTIEKLSIHQAMSEEQLQAILATVAENADLRTKLNNANDADAVVALAKEAGFTITLDAFDRAPLEVSDEHLESVVGSGQAAVAKCKRPACLTATSKNDASA